MTTITRLSHFGSRLVSDPVFRHVWDIKPLQEQEKGALLERSMRIRRLQPLLKRSHGTAITALETLEGCLRWDSLLRTDPSLWVLLVDRVRRKERVSQEQGTCAGGWDSR